jgi:hypothetical protein
MKYLIMKVYIENLELKVDKSLDIHNRYVCLDFYSDEDATKKCDTIFNQDNIIEVVCYHYVPFENPKKIYSKQKDWPFNQLKQHKFKVWDTTNKCWLNEFFINNGGVFILNNESKFEFKPDVQILQFINMFDSRNNEIYEGDVLIDETESTSKYKTRFVVIVIEGRIFLREVNSKTYSKFLNESVNTYEECQDFLSYDRAKDYMVVGNVFDNPHLLVANIEENVGDDK